MTNPSTGDPLNGVYTFVFRLYNVDTGGTELWTETKDLTVTNGLFSTLLGDAALPVVQFTGQDLWLGIKVGADAEAAPRQRIAPGDLRHVQRQCRPPRRPGRRFHRNASNINGDISRKPHC
ncbi:MAG: hypothetical protein R2856_15115 [Caldilineaceae bacterium]